ncbi:Uma2 family endonuclease [Candidatus Poribacteria bacterium]|nr:Uma2 family endonuclease [Candidatus Poribacteria bacterium]
MDVISVPTTEATKKKISFEDYLLMPEINHPYEIIDGEFMPSPAPIPAHQRMSANIFKRLDEHVEAKGLGVVLFAPVDIILQRHPLRTRQPDVLFIHKDKLSGTGFDAIEELQILEIAPDLVVEVLSTSDTERVLSGKLADYQPIGVKECWLVSREARSVEGLQLTKEQSQSLGHFGLGETIRSEVLPNFQMTVDAIFT